jgi:dolichol-phosphate mannosyltransferase
MLAAALSIRRCGAVAGKEADPSVVASRRQSRVAAGLFVTAAAVLCFTGFRSALQEPQEARYAEIARQMLAERSFVVPVLHGQPYCDKPPLFYWLLIGSYSLLGPDDWSARLVCCAIAFLCVVTTWWWGRWVANPRGAFLGAMILCLSPRFLQLERMVTMDGLLCLGVVAAWATAHQAMLSNARERALAGRASDGFAWWILSAIACGMGILAKGPVALVLVLPPVIVYRWLAGRASDGNGPGHANPQAGHPTPTSSVAGTPLGHVSDEVNPRHWPATFRWLGGYLVLSLGLAAPWFAAVAFQESSFAGYFFWFHHVQRFLEPFDHEEPFWYYLPVLLGGMLPWTLLLPAMVRWMVQKFHRPGRLDSPVAELLVTAVWCLLFFSLSGCKRPFYILPAMPPLALALGCYLDTALPAGWNALRKHRTRLAAVVAVLTLLAGSGLALAANIAGISDSTSSVILAVLFGCGFVAVIGEAVRHRGRLSWAVGITTVFVVLLAGVSEWLPGYARKFSLRGQVRRHQLLAKAGNLPVFCYPRRWDSVSFYLKRDDVRVFPEKQLPLLIENLERHARVLVFLKTGKPGASPARELLDRLPGSLRFEPIGRQGQLTVGIVQRAAGESRPGRVSPPLEAVAREPADSFLHFEHHQGVAQCRNVDGQHLRQLVEVP